METSRATFTQSGAALVIRLQGPGASGTLNGMVAERSFEAQGSLLDGGETAATRIQGELSLDGASLSGAFEQLFPADCGVTGAFRGARP